MLRQPNIENCRLGNFLLVVVVLLLLAGTAQASGQVSGNTGQSANANQQSQITKWDAGQKELECPNAGTPEASDKASQSSNLSAMQSADAPVYVTFLSFLAKLGFVAALAYGTIWALKRFSGLKGSVGGKRNCIRVVENTALAANRSLHLVEVDSKRLLVASTPGQISLLTELQTDDLGSQTDPTSAAPQSASIDHQSDVANTFAAQLSSFLGAKPDTGDSAKNVAALIRGSSTFLQEKVMLVGRIRKELRDA